MTEFNAGTATMMENESASAAQYEAVEQFSQKTHVTLEEARAALEAADWNALTATHLLEQEAFRRKQELNEAVADSEAAAPREAAEEAEKPAQAASGEQARAKSNGSFKKLGSAVMELIACGNRSRFAIHRGGKQLLEMPVTVLALLLLCSFGTCAFLMVVGLFADCRYIVNGKGFRATEA